MNVNRKAGLDFATGLALDPPAESRHRDGREIRDAETARIAIRGGATAT